MATYKQIQAEIKKRYGYSAVTGWIAHVKNHHGLTTRIAPNRIDPTKRVRSCPPKKWKDIEAVLQSFGMIEQPKKTSPFPQIKYVGGGTKKTALMSTDDSPWYWLIQQAIFHDSDSANKEPDGWHWLIFLHYILEFNVADIQKKLPDSHPLKSASLPTNAIKSKYKPTINEFNRKTNFTPGGGNKRWFHIMNFSNLIIEDPLHFSNFIFPIKVEFIHSEFSQDVFFNNTVFLNDVFFTNAVFSDTANFKNAEFHGRTANFRNATFKKEANFEKTIFKNYANFKSATFSDRTIFQLAKFKYHAPRFYDATFNNELILNRVELPESNKFKDDEHYETYQKTIEENKSAYETLIYLMEKQNKHHDKHRFFREEMRWRQLGNKLTQKRLKDDSRKIINAKHPISRCIGIFLTCISFCFCNKIACYFSHKKQDVDYFIWKRIENRLTITLFGLYEYLSDYGYGIGRAIFWWFLHILIGSLILFTIRYFNCFKDFTDDFGCSLGISLSNSHAFFFNGERLEKCYKAFENLPWFNFIWGVQTITGTLLIFLVLLTLRIRFRLK